MHKVASITSWLNPFPTTGLSPKSSESTLDDRRRMRLMLRDSAKAGVSWAALMLAARFAINRNSELKAEAGSSKIVSALNAKQPLVSLDTNLNDVEQEEALRRLGTEPTPEPGEKPRTRRKGGLRKKASVLAWPVEALKSFGRKDLSSYHIAAVLTAAIAGGAAGWRLADKIADTRNRRKLESRIGDEENMLEALRTQERQELVGKTAAEKRPEVGVLKGLSALYPVYFLGMLALTYRAAKGYMDKTDVNRLRLKEIEKLMKEKAKVEQPPTFVSVAAPAEGAVRETKARIRKPVSLSL